MSPRRRKENFETALLAISMAALVVLIGGLVWSSFNSGTGPPELRVAVMPTGKGTEVAIVVSNVGGSTAERVIVEAEAGEESHEIEFPFVNNQEEERATADLGQPASQVQASVKSYAER